MTEQPSTPRRHPIVSTETVIRQLNEHRPTRLARIEACARVLETDLAAHQPQCPDDRDLALAALRGWISDKVDATDDTRVARFYLGQYEADGTKPVVNYESLPVEHKRSWRRKYRAALASIESVTPSTQEA